MGQPSCCREAARDRIDRVPAQRQVTISAIDAFAAAGWHSPTTSGEQYQVIAPNTLKITEELGSTVVDYHVDGTRLVLSGDGLERLLGKTQPPQVLDETSQ